MRISKEFKVGLFMVIAIAILYIGFNFLKGEDFFSSNNKYYAIYENIDGLNNSNPVLISGYAVGRVSQITLLQNNGNRVLVELDIQGDVVLGDSATAILTGDFLGNKSITLTIGDRSRPKMPNDTLIAVLDRGLAEIFTESAQPVANSLESTIKKINTILDNLTGNSDKINSMLESFEKTPRILNNTILGVHKNVDAITANMSHVTRTLDTTLKKTHPMLDNMGQFTDSLKNLELQKTLNTLDAAVVKLDQAIEHFSTNNGTLGRLINDDSLYVNLNNAVESLDRLLKHIDTQPKHFFAPLGKSKRKIERDRREAKSD